MIIKKCEELEQLLKDFGLPDHELLFLQEKCKDPLQIKQMEIWKPDSKVMTTIVNGIERCPENPQVAFAALTVIEICIPQTVEWKTATVQSRIAFFEELKKQALSCAKNNKNDAKIAKKSLDVLQKLQKMGQP